MTIDKTSKTIIWAVAILLFAAIALYLFTLDNGLRPDELTGGDLITHQYAQVEARPSNAPGYPLYTMGGWLWFKLGSALLGWALTPIQILSLYSTLWGVASLGVLYLILLRIMRGRWPLALLLAAFYATTYFFWYYSVTTEQYTSAVFQTLLLVWLAFVWDDNPKDWPVLLMAFVSGTMLANMLTTLFILPPLLWFIFSRRHLRDQQIFLLTYLRRPKFVLAAVGLALLPLISYAYIYVRGAQHPEWRGEGNWQSSWDWFVQFLTIQQGRDEFAPGLTLSNFFTAEFPSLMWQELAWVGFFFGLVGLMFLGRRRAIFLYSTLVIYFIFSWGYRFGNWFQVIIPAYPIFVIGLGAGLTKIIEVVAHRWPSKKISRMTYTLIIVFLVGLLIYRFSVSLPRANQHNLAVDTGLVPGQLLLADNPTTPAIIIGDFSERVALQYLSTVWDVDTIYPADPVSIPDITPAHIYISRQAIASNPEVVEQKHLQAAGAQLILLADEPQSTLPATAISTNINFGDELTLVGWEASADESELNWQMALYWQASAPLTEDYTVSVRPLREGQLIAGDDDAPVIQDHQPVWGAYPTSRWTPGEIVRDVYAVSLPNEINPTAVQVVVYRTIEGGFENLNETVIELDSVDPNFG